MASGLLETSEDFCLCPERNTVGRGGGNSDSKAKDCVPDPVCDSGSALAALAICVLIARWSQQQCPPPRVAEGELTCGSAYGARDRCPRKREPLSPSLPPLPSPRHHLPSTRKHRNHEVTSPSGGGLAVCSPSGTEILRRLLVTSPPGPVQTGPPSSTWLGAGS